MFPILCGKNLSDLTRSQIYFFFYVTKTNFNVTKNHHHT